MRPIPIQEENACTPMRMETKCGSFSLILGCMFSGKTTELIARTERYPAETVLAIKHVIDTRFGRDAIITHGGKALPAIPVPTGAAILVLTSVQTQVVAIDEGHFFDPELIGVIEELNRRGVDVLLTSLDPDSWGRPFPINQMLRELASECLQKTAVCARCSAVADRTQRLTRVVGGNMVVDPSHYEPRCRACWRPPTEELVSAKA